MTWLAAPRRCLGGELPEYAAGRLPAPMALVWDRHVAVCERCRSAVASERRLQALLTGGPAVPSALLASLMSLGAQATTSRPVVPPPPRASLRTVNPWAPPVHRSPVRSALVATAAAGASAAAAWGLAVTTSAGPARGAPPPAAPGLTARAAARGGTASAGNVAQAVLWRPESVGILPRP